MNYVIATSRSWHEGMADRLRKSTSETFVTLTKKTDLNFERLEEINPEYIFFPHWSYMIPKEIFNNFECVIFHMTDVPFGRGGSPLQNLISRGIYDTKVTALRCVADVDAGPVYLKRPLTLHGNAEEIYIRSGQVIEEMILDIIKTEPQPTDQEGQPTIFKRRQPAQSTIAGVSGLDILFDHIRMLDADGYPHAYIEIEGFRFELTRASLRNGSIIADVKITEIVNE